MMEYLINGFKHDKTKITFFQNESVIWEVNRIAITIIAISEVINGDNETTIFSVVDNKCNIYHLDFSGLMPEYINSTFNFFVQNYGLEKNIQCRDTTAIFYPRELKGKYPYDNSIITWFIRLFFNAAGGRLNKSIKNYCAPAGATSAAGEEE